MGHRCGAGARPAAVVPSAAFPSPLRFRLVALLAPLTVLAFVAGLGLPAAPAAARSPRIDYMLECQGCHLPDGRGRPDAVPSLRGVGRFLRVPGGRAYLVQVPGSAQAPLDDAALAAVLTWMVREFGPPEVAERMAPYTAEEVGRLRAEPLLDVTSVRRALLAELEALVAPDRPRD